jgi:hypothetical protein
MPKLSMIRGRKRANGGISFRRWVEPVFDANYTKPGQGAAGGHPVSYFGIRRDR